MFLNNILIFNEFKYSLHQAFTLAQNFLFYYLKYEI